METTSPTRLGLIVSVRFPMIENAPHDLYLLFQDSPEAEELDLSAMDFGWVAVAFLANGGGTLDEFRDWLKTLTYEDAQKIVRS